MRRDPSQNITRRAPPARAIGYIRGILEAQATAKTEQDAPHS